MGNKGLKKIVPPLELCKQIPEGAFADSALVWAKFPRNNGEYFSIVERSSFALLRARDRYPAPTLAEILEALPTIQYSTEGTDFYLMLCDYRNRGDGWGIGYGRMSHGVFKGLVKACKGDKNPATAALKLWLEIKQEARDE